ncbi:MULTISPECIES: hypothetical protein [unclassified Lysinibacillus]|uniref:hypothetical protein n=1 Tax=unclassified Lysinibacillus TaxID=2636778 RepID=UPI00088AC4AC|nr:MULTISPECIES: hypothetical protein [unclassified Lysinibacillus]SCY87323.1 hypothetical protein SAMN02787078_02818 [Lysinibacillus sp. SG9]SDB38413.1 hypothetical protein SAMN02787079_02858 [Lysinibacillus sp. TC-37]SFT02453.1 hypothetical protein SAMN02787087_03113 [Lysinibacillus sp. SG55]
MKSASAEYIISLMYQFDDDVRYIREMVSKGEIIAEPREDGSELLVNEYNYTVSNDAIKDFLKKKYDWNEEYIRGRINNTRY